MFEKEAEEYFEKECLHSYADTEEELKEDVMAAFKSGAEFGYNKANEWHFVKDGDLPKDEDYKWCVSSRGYPYVARYEELFVSWTNRENKEVMCPYAWKEIVFPKESE